MRLGFLVGSGFAEAVRVVDEWIVDVVVGPAKLPKSPKSSNEFMSELEDVTGAAPTGAAKSPKSPKSPNPSSAAAAAGGSGWRRWGCCCCCCCWLTDCAVWTFEGFDVLESKKPRPSRPMADDDRGTSFGVLVPLLAMRSNKPFDGAAVAGCCRSDAGLDAGAEKSKSPNKSKFEVE